MPRGRVAASGAAQSHEERVAAVAAGRAARQRKEDEARERNKNAALRGDSEACVGQRQVRCMGL